MAEDLRFGAMLSHHVVVGRLGAGGMGVVYRARDAKLDRDVALKILPPDFAADPDRQRRFEREAKAASSLSHPGVAHIYELAEAEGVHFIVMEYMEGKTLQDLVVQGPLSAEMVLDVAAQVADALHEAHALKKAYADGTIAVDMDPLSLRCRLATSVPPPRRHTIRYAGVLAPASP